MREITTRGEQVADAREDANAVLEARDHVVGERKLAAGRNLELEVGTGEIVTLLGDDGAGPTAPPLTPSVAGTA